MKLRREGDRTRCEASLSKTLAELQLDYIDLYLIHWPFAFEETVLEKPAGSPQPLRLPDGSPNPIWTIKMEYLATWRALESFHRDGRCRSIGVSNFTTEQLEHLLGVCEIPPSVNQVEVHPYLQQAPLVDFCTGKGIAVMGYSPLGSSFDRPPPAVHGVPLLNHPVVLAAAERHGRTPAQVLLRWGLQRYPTTFVTIPKSGNEDRIAANIDVLDWALDEDSMAQLAGLECGHRLFMSYLKKPDNAVIWHEGVIETGGATDFI